MLSLFVCLVTKPTKNGCTKTFPFPEVINAQILYLKDVLLMPTDCTCISWTLFDPKQFMSCPPKIVKLIQDYKFCKALNCCSLRARQILCHSHLKAKLLSRWPRSELWYQHKMAANRESSSKLNDFPTGKQPSSESINLPPNKIHVIISGNRHSGLIQPHRVQKWWFKWRKRLSNERCYFVMEVGLWMQHFWTRRGGVEIVQKVGSPKCLRAI